MTQKGSLPALDWHCRHASTLLLCRKLNYKAMQILVIGSHLFTFILQKNEWFTDWVTCNEGDCVRELSDTHTHAHIMCFP